MGLYSKQISTGRLIEWQSHGNEKTLEKNAVAVGIGKADLEFAEANLAEWLAALSNDPTRVAEREILQEEQMISDKTRSVAEDRDRKEAVKQLKIEGKTLKYHNDRGNKI